MTTEVRSAPRRVAAPDYGVDGHVFVLALLGSGLGAVALGTVLLVAVDGSVARVAGAVMCALGVAALVPALLGIHYVKRGKFVHRDRVLDRVQWRGDEQTLDIGTGGGLLLVGAARRTPQGRAIGVDVWASKDLSNNTYARAMKNVVLEGVADRAEIRSEDARALPFPDETFDVVVSMLCLHNIEDDAGQDAALREAVRVCKRGGVILISDLANTDRYARTLEELGMEVTLLGPFPDTFPPQRLIEARMRACQ